MHPRSRHWHLLDYSLVRQRDIGDILHTGTTPSVECHTDHLVHCTLYTTTFQTQIEIKEEGKALPRKS